MLSEEEIEEIAAEARGKDIAAVICYLKRELEEKLVAYMAGLKKKDINKLDAWSIGSGGPDELREARLRTAYHVVKLLSSYYRSASVYAWLMGTNSFLDGKAPAYALRHGKLEKDFESAVNAAKSFIWTS